MEQPLCSKEHRGVTLECQGGCKGATAIIDNSISDLSSKLKLFVRVQNLKEFF